MKKYHIYLSDDERKLIIESLLHKKNSLILAKRFTDGVDEILLKILKSKRKKLRII